MQRRFESLRGLAKPSSTGCPVEVEFLVNRGMIRRALRHNGAPAAALEDLEQDVVEALLRLGGATRRAQLSTWIWAVCRNVTVDHRKRERVRVSRAPDAATALLASVSGPADQLHEAEIKSWLYGALWRLPPTLRRVVFLREIEGSSYAEVAIALHITEMAARAAHHRGIKRLAERGDEVL